MLSCIKHACFHVFSPFSAYFSPHDIVVEKGLLHMCSTSRLYTIGRTAVLIGFALEPLDCLLQCYESVNTAGKRHPNCCEEGSAPGQDLVSGK